MALEQTLAAIKPDAMEKGVIGEIIMKAENANLKMIGCKLLHLDKKRAEGFYAVHKGKPFFESLVTFMTSGPSLIFVLEGENDTMAAIVGEVFRDTIGNEGKLLWGPPKDRKKQVVLKLDGVEATSETGVVHLLHELAKAE